MEVEKDIKNIYLKHFWRINKWNTIKNLNIYL